LDEAAQIIRQKKDGSEYFGEEQTQDRGKNIVPQLGGLLEMDEREQGENKEGGDGKSPVSNIDRQPDLGRSSLADRFNGLKNIKIQQDGDGNNDRYKFPVTHVDFLVIIKKPRIHPIAR
jgi:hypothetical protein